MIKKIIIPILAATLATACNQDPKPGNFQQVDTPQVNVDPNATAIEKIKAQALDEGDYVGRVSASLKPLQDELNNAKGKIKGIGDVTVKVDDQFNLLIENKEGGHVYQTAVNLKNLNPEQGGMMLIPDLTEAEDPGLKIFVLDGKKGVTLSKDGVVQKEERFLEFRLPERSNIEKLTPSMVQALYVVHGKVE